MWTPAATGFFIGLRLRFGWSGIVKADSVSVLLGLDGSVPRGERECRVGVPCLHV